MLAIFHLPIADLRRLAAERPAVSLPRVPGRTVTSDSGIVDSLRYFGWAQERGAGADATFPDEKGFYSAHRAIRLIGLGKRAFQKAGMEVEPKISAFRRLFLTDQKVTARLEVGVSVQARQKPLEFDALIQLLEAVLGLPTEIRGGKAGERPLVLQGKALAAHFASATSRRSPDESRRAAKLVRPCQPMLVAELRHGEFLPGEIARNLPYFRRLDRGHTAGVDVWFGQISAAQRKIPAWLLAPGTAKVETVRSLRLCLLRLHAEHRVAEEVLQWLDGDPEPAVDAENLESYLGDVWKKVFDRAQRASLDQSAILSAVAAAAAVRSEVEATFLKDRLDRTRQKFARNEPQAAAGPRPSEAPWKAWLERLERQPDLTIVLQRQGGSALLWSFLSPHGVRLPENPVQVEIGSEPHEFAQRVMNILGAVRAGPILYDTLRGIGSTIGETAPPDLWRLLREVAEAVKSRPTVLILSEEQYVPWELARNPGSPDSPFLAAETVVGRWMLPNGNTDLRLPPTEIRIESAAFISGRYSEGGSLNDLPGAREEVQEIAADLGRSTPPTPVTQVEAESRELVEYFRSEPEARLLHFAVHGKYDPELYEDGLLTTDGKALNPFAVRSFKLRGSPFVFLNACEVGQGQQVLGSSSGMSEAFLAAGASAVVAPLWPVDDTAAHRIALDFYRAVRDGDPGEAGLPSVAELLRRERARFDMAATSPSSLAYKFFGHPELRLTLLQPEPSP